MSEHDWDKAERHLRRCEKAYGKCGSSGYYYLSTVIRPLRDRFNKGERTSNLYEKIMKVCL